MIRLPYLKTKKLYLYFFLCMTGIIPLFIHKNSNFFGDERNNKVNQELVNINKNIAQAFRDKNMLQIASFFSDSAIIITKSNRFCGRKEIDAFWLNNSDSCTNYRIVNSRFSFHDKWVIQNGFIRIRISLPREESVSKVRFTWIWSQINKKWFIEVADYSLD